MKEHDSWWNRQKKQRRIDNVNHCSGSRVNGKPLFEGQPRTPQVDAKIKRRELLKKALPFTLSAVVGAIGGFTEAHTLEAGRITNLEQAVGGHETRLDDHTNVLRGHGRVLLDHDKRLTK